MQDYAQTETNRKQNAYEMFSYHKNPLIVAANPLLNVIPQIRHSATNVDPVQLRLQLIDEIKRFEIRAQNSGFTYEVIIGARYCLCTVLDEAAALTPWGSRVWSANGLLVTFHNETWGGEKFFQLLAKLSQNPKEHLFLLELLNICLLLGFEGRYRVIENGRSQLETLNHRLLRLINDERGGYPPPLSLHAEDKPVLLKFWRPMVPLWACAALAGFICSLLFITLNWKLGDATSPVLASIYQSIIPRPVVNEKDLKPKVKVVIRLRLKQLLHQEIKAGILDVIEDEEDITGESKVIFNGDNLFASGATTISPSYEPLLKKIADEINKLSGDVTILGHTDNVPLASRIRFASNIELSEARAVAVQKILHRYLRQSGRTFIEGHGESKPVAANNTVEGRAKNRRVEIIFRPDPGGEAVVIENTTK